MTGSTRGLIRRRHLLELIAKLAALRPHDRRVVIARLKPSERRALKEMWEAWAHGGQVAPPGDWRVWMLVAGRGFGKTRAGAEWISALARANASLRIALVGATPADVRRIMIEGTSGLLAVANDGERPVWQPSLGRLRFASGAEAAVFGGADPEPLRGPEHDIAWADELAKWKRPGETWHNLDLGVRVGDRPRILVTTTPRPLPLLRRLLDAADTAVTGGRTVDNLHLPAAYLRAMAETYAGTRLGRQELDGELLSDVEGSLWPRALIERQRRPSGLGLPAMTRVVIGVDPPAGSGPGADACGIVAVGLSAPDPVTGQTCGYVLDDASVRGERPDGWARAVVATYRRWNASRVVAEKNQGGDMVESVLRAVEAGLSLRLVHASRGKVARAEPVAALYENGRVFHASAFPALEDELAGLTANGGYEGPGSSPDRADALVWAVTELMLGDTAAEPRVRFLG